MLVLYDGDCGFCAWALAWILRWDRARKLRPLAIQSEEGQRALAGMEPQLRLASWHARDERGELSSGSSALPALLERLPRGRAPAALLRRFPGLSAAAYRWVARNRIALSRPVPQASKRRARTLIAQRMSSAGRVAPPEGESPAPTSAAAEHAPGGTPAEAEAELLARHGILRVLAPNPGPFTLAGTNAWLVGREPTWVIDPGPLLQAHLERLLAAIEERGGLGGIALTHDHRDHAEAVRALLERHPAPLAAGRGRVDVTLQEGLRFGPLEAVFTPGHAPDHYAFIARGACFTGDAVLGEGSVFIAPDPGAMSGYLRALERLGRREDLSLLCPGHGPVVPHAHAKLQEYLEHRTERERKLKLALARGLRKSDELLGAAWPEVPLPLRGAALATLAAHLDKLEEEGALPDGVERPALQRSAGA